MVRPVIFYTPSSIPCGRQSLKLLEPVQHDVGLGDWRLTQPILGLLNHQEPLTVRGNIVASVRTSAQIRSVKERVWFPRGEGWIGRDVNGHHLSCFANSGWAAVEQFPPVPRPGRRLSAAGRDPFFDARARIGSRVDLRLPGLVGSVRQPATVGRKSGVRYSKRWLHKRAWLAVTLELQN